MDLKTASEIYKNQTEEQQRKTKSNPIKKYLRACLKSKAELLFEIKWDRINNYYPTFHYKGSPKSGTVKLVLRDKRICFGMGQTVEYPDIILAFRQMDLFEK